MIRKLALVGLMTAALAVSACGSNDGGPAMASAPNPPQTVDNPNPKPKPEPQRVLALSDCLHMNKAHEYDQVTRWDPVKNEIGSGKFEDRYYELIPSATQGAVLYEQLDQREFAKNSFQSFTEHYVFLFDTPDAAQTAAAKQARAEEKGALLDPSDEISVNGRAVVILNGVPDYYEPEPGYKACLDDSV